MILSLLISRLYSGAEERRRAVKDEKFIIGCKDGESRVDNMEVNAK